MERQTYFDGYSYQPLSSKVECVQALGKLEDAEGQGLLHIAPIADGTTIFRALEYNELFDEAAHVGIDSYVFGFTETVYGEKDKDWFLTSQEAEKGITKPLYCGLSTTPISPDGSGITEPSNPKYKRQIYSSRGLIFDSDDLKVDE